MKIHSALDDIYVFSINKEMPYVVRGLNLFPDEGWDPDAVERIRSGTATADDLLKHINHHDAGNYWFSSHSPEEAKKETQYSEVPEGEHPADMEDERNENGKVWGQVGVTLVGRRPALSPEHDHQLDHGNNIIPASTIHLHHIHYTTDSNGNFATADARGHSVRTKGSQSEWEYPPEDEINRKKTIKPLAAAQPKPGPLSWDDIGDLWPHVYGDSEIHGDAAQDADGPGIGDAANYLAHETPQNPDAENNTVHDLEFHRKMIHPKNIDFSPSGQNDPRVKRAREGYQNNENEMPPLVLVHRHGVYQVADGHHRAEAAKGLNKPVRAYVAYSPHENEPFRDGEKGPFHGAVSTGD
jgi:hypothetical protein